MAQVRSLFKTESFLLLLPAFLLPSAASPQEAPLRALRPQAQKGRNLLDPRGWRFRGGGTLTREGLVLLDNGKDPKARKDAWQTLRLDQKKPTPVVALVSSKCEGVSGSPDRNYSLYLDLIYQDGTPLWGQAVPFETGTHDWTQKRVVVYPDKPVRQVSVHLLLRGHAGKAWFRKASLTELRTPRGFFLFDGVPVTPAGPLREEILVRDVQARSGYLRLRRNRALGLEVRTRRTRREGITFLDLHLRETTGGDRALTLVVVRPVPPGEVAWFDGPGAARPARGRGEFGSFARFPAVAGGRLSRWPFGALQAGKKGLALGLAPRFPAFFRAAYNASARVLYLAFDLGFTKEKPKTRLRICSFDFDPAWGFRSALAAYSRIFPEAFRRRIGKHGLWMPFARISRVKGWRDFGFRFKEGTNETAWDEAHGILTFRYTEPMTWWMPMKKDLPRTREAALAEARRLAARDRGTLGYRARALFVSGFHDEKGRIPVLFRDYPWCNGAVWSVNEMPGIRGPVTAFSYHWNEKIRKRYYESPSKPRLDGEYVDSSEGWVTAPLDFRRDHFAAAATPLTFSRHTHRPAIFRGLIVFEYVRALARYVHGRGRFMMANATPSRLFWLAPLLDVMGTETNWNRNGRWSPMSLEKLLYRRGLCGKKPYCFLMNTRFELFSHEMVERYMKRAAAFGMFPGFFSSNASTGHYFTRPELYERDRPLFKKYVPLCKRLSEAGWEPIPLARAQPKDLHVERFGKRYLTLFNPSNRPLQGRVEILLKTGKSVKELLSGKLLPLRLGRKGVSLLEITLGPEALAVLDLRTP